MQLSVEEMIQVGLGQYAQDKYDPTFFQQILDQFPEGISAQTAYNRLIRDLAEEYRTPIEGMKQVDPTFYTHLQMRSRKR